MNTHFLLFTVNCFDFYFTAFEVSMGNTVIFHETEREASIHPYTNYVISKIS